MGTELAGWTPEEPEAVGVGWGWAAAGTVGTRSTLTHASTRTHTFFLNRVPTDRPTKENQERRRRGDDAAAAAETRALKLVRAEGGGGGGQEGCIGMHR